MNWEREIAIFSEFDGEFQRVAIKSSPYRPDNRTVKPARLSLVQAARTVLRHRVETPHWRNVRTAQGSVAANGCPLKAIRASERYKVRIRATETSRLSAGETGNLYAQQYQVGQR